VRDRVASTTRLDRWLSARLAAAYRVDLQNVRQAFSTSVAGQHVDDAVEIAVGGAFLWRNVIGCAEDQRWVEQLLALDLSPRDQLWVHLLAADVAQGRGDARGMFEAGSAAQAVAEEAGDAAGATLAPTTTPWSTSPTPTRRSPTSRRPSSRPTRPATPASTR
jgi:hypothetical protein